MVMSMTQGKQNQHGKVEYMGCMRNADPILCPLSAIAFYFFNRWGKDGAESFPSFRQPEDYYNLYTFPGSIKVPQRPLSYHTQFEWNKKMFQGVGIYSKEKTHSARKQSVRHAELSGVKETQIRRAGRWNTDAMTGAYLSYLPRAFMRSIAGFPKEGKGYFLPRAQEVPEEALCSKIWPETDVWLKRMETYHPDRTDNEVVRLDLAGSGFLRLLRALRVILLQDSVILPKQFPLHPLWKDSLFGCEEYQRFAVRVESSLANIVTPDELIMRKYWPAHEAVAKLRHEATISEMKGVQLRVETILERLDEIERSSASFAPAPIWIQQGKTGIWIGPTESVYPPLGGPTPPTIMSTISAPPAQLSTMSAPPAQLSAISAPPAQLSAISAPPGQLSAISAPPGQLSAISAPPAQLSTVSAPPAQPSTISAPPPLAQAQADTQPPLLFILDPQAPPRKYKMLRGGNSVFQLWTEWTLGLAGGPSIEALDRCWGARWRVDSEAMFYSRRRRIIKDIRRRVEDGTARDDRQAIDQLEQLRGRHSLDWLCKNI